MKKGEIKKQEFINTAEELFCRNGYESTSVQDIIDSLNTSKGSFYHHFISKEALLEEICSRRAEQISGSVLHECEMSPISIGKLDILLSGMIPFRDERLRFLLMLLPVFTLPEGRTVRYSFCDKLSSCFYLPVYEQLVSGHKSGMLFCKDPDNAALLILSIINYLWVRISDMMINAEMNRRETDIAECLRIVENCRESIERMLSIPFGSIKLIDMPALKLLNEKIHNHWPQIKSIIN